MSTITNSIQKFEAGKTDVEVIFEENKFQREARKQASAKLEENKRIHAELEGAKKYLCTLRDNIAIAMTLFMTGISILGSLMMTLNFLATIGFPASGTGMFIVGFMFLVLYGGVYFYMFEYIRRRIVKKRK